MNRYATDLNRSRLPLWWRSIQASKEICVKSQSSGEKYPLIHFSAKELQNGSRTAW